jgi:hypothetical protein
MLISRRDGELVLVTHVDHAAVAGVLAERWSLEASEGTRAALVAAAVRHDDGWAELDGRPVFSAEQQRPAHFLEVPLPETVPPYRAGVERLAAEDPHAGLLASMHWAGLYSSRWGVQGTPPVEHPAAQAVVAEQEQTWPARSRALWGAAGGLRSEFERELWLAYEVLQALDLLSLFLCTADLSRPSGSAPEDPPVWATLATIDQPAGGRVLPSVPSAGGHADVRLAVEAPGTVTLDPCPFGAEPVPVVIPVRRLEDRPYADAEAAAAALRAAPVEPVAVTLTGV